MKTLLFLLAIMALTTCTSSDAPAPETPTVVDEAMEIFVYNKEILEDEIMLGSLCLTTFKKTGSQENKVCELYRLTQKQATTMSRLGVKIFTELHSSGALADDNTYLEVIDIIERLTKVEIMAKKIRKEIENTSGSECIKCAI